MKLFVFVMVFALATCATCDTEPHCDLPAKLCKDPDRCYCLDIIPTDHCSGRKYCPATCPDTRICYGRKDDDGCPSQETCLAADDEESECPNLCPANCNTNLEKFCPGGKDASNNDCPMEDSCVTIDTLSTCPTICPVNCGTNETKCNGETGSDRCLTNDYCIGDPSKSYPSDPSACPAVCGKICGLNETVCPSADDSNDCPTQGTCLLVDLTAICQASCTPICLTGEELCDNGVDENGCEIAGTCVETGGCNQDSDDSQFSEDQMPPTD